MSSCNGLCASNSVAVDAIGNRYVATGLPALVTAAFAMLFIAATAHKVFAGEPAVALMGNHPVADFTNFGPADKDRRLDLRIILALRNKAALDELLAAQQDPNSPQYHHWLTPNEFHAKFGPSPKDIGAIVEWLKSEGLSAADEADGRSVRLTATVAQVERIFRVAIVTSASGLIYANTSDPLIPARFAGVIARIEGLDNMRIVVPANRTSRRPRVVPSP